MKSDFLRNSGSWVTLSSMLGKVFGFLMMIFLVRNITKDDFGLLTIAINFIGFFLPSVGFGAHHGLIRFGAMQKGTNQDKLVSYSLISGFKNQVILSIVVIVSGIALNFEKPVVCAFVLVMVFRLFGIFFLEMAKAELRAKFQNDRFAKLEITSNFFAVVLGVGFTLLWGVWGYVVSLCVFPYCVFLLHRFRFKKVHIPLLLKKIFWNFSVQSVVTLIIYMWVFLLDVFFVGRYFSSEEVGFYKLSTLVPMNLLVVAQVYTQTLYPEMCNHRKDRKYLLNFIGQYFKIYVPVSAFILAVGWFFGRQILSIFGGYQDTQIQNLMFLQVVSCILLRVPFGNLIGSMGHISVSLVLGIVMMVGICVSNILFLPESQPVMAAKISLAWITFGGILAAVYFFATVNKLKT